MTVPAHVSRGEGPETILFLHGVGGGKECWEPQLDAFADRYRTVAWDMPGYGETATLSVTSFPTLAQSLAELIDHLDSGPVHLVGHSLGGMVAQEFAAAHPDGLRSLVLSGTSPAFGKPGGDWQRQFIAERLGPLDEGRGMADLAPGIVASMVGDSPDPAGIERAVECMGQVLPATYRTMMQILITFDRRDALPRITAPTLVLAGEKDTNATPAMMARMAERIPGAGFECLPGAGHLANMERPAAFNRVLRSFLDGISDNAPERLEM